jgi:hypothetical protein
MHWSARDIGWTMAIALAIVAVVASASSDHMKRSSGSGDARILVEQADFETIDLKVNGERIKEDGRLRFTGSIARTAEMDLVRWDFACDPNPYGGASIEGAFEVEGPFDGILTIDLPLDPIVEGRVALKSSVTLRAATESPGVLLALGSREAAMNILVDHRSAVRLGQGPLSIERRSAGASSVRRWSSGEDEGEEPTFVEFARDTLSIRVRCVLEEGRSAIYFGRVHLVGDPTDFQFRKDTEQDGKGSVIPRRGGSISISVPGAGQGGTRGRGTGRVNKPPAVIRPSKRPARESGD